MNLVIVSNNRKELRYITNSILNETFDCFINEFVDPMHVLKYVFSHRVDAVFADINMKPSNGIDLMKVLKIKRPLLPIYLISKDYEDKMRGDFASDRVLHIPFDREILKRIIIALS